MQLILVRHGEPVAAEVAPGSGHGADPGLSALGHAQAARLATWAAATPDDVAEVVVSPMRRARETAAPVEEALGLDARVVDDLAEFDRGQQSYRPVRDLEGSSDPDWERLRSGRFPTYVDAEAFVARVREAMSGIAAGRTGRSSVLVVCHAGVVNTWVTGLLGLERPLVFPLDHVSLTRVLVARDGSCRVRSVNETGHVEDLR